MSLIGAANDIIATRFHLSVESVTWTVRIGLFVAPVAAYAVTKRCALGLQRRDRGQGAARSRDRCHQALAPYGQFVEVHAPLSQAELHLRTQHEQYTPIAPGPNGKAESPGADARLSWRLRVKFSRAFYGEGSQIPKPTLQEYQEIANEHLR